MKVKIGPYINRWTTTDFEEWWLSKRSGTTRWEKGRDTYKETELDKFVEWACDHWQTVLNVTVNQYFDNKKRKIDIRIDGHDVWSMDYTLSLIVLPMLKKLKANKNGAPSVDDKDVPKKLRSTNAPRTENDWDTDDLFFQRWEWVMDELVWTFTQIADENNDDQFHTGNIDLQFKKKEGSKFSGMVKGPKDTHVYDSKGHAKHDKRIQRGLILFGKYYRGLWD